MHQYFLQVTLEGNDPGPALSGLLDAWQSKVLGALKTGLMAPRGSAADTDTALVLTVPSLDTRYVLPLMRAHFTPVTNLAARVVRATAGGPGAIPPSAGPRALPPGMVVRRATERDLDAVGDLAAQLHGYDTRFGAVSARPGSRRLLAGGVVETHRGGAGWTWVLEQDGDLCGFAQLQNPDQAAWIQHLALHPGRSGYLASAFVRPGSRGAGLGAALVAAVHAEASVARLPSVVLHHATANPLSAPFWARQGYRGLFTIWQRRPAFAAGMG
ncbi:MAG: GNAT family N-acetyltransferase [Actinomycetales bacterium]